MKCGGINQIGMKGMYKKKPAKKPAKKKIMTKKGKKKSSYGY